MNSTVIVMRAAISLKLLQQGFVIIGLDQYTPSTGKSTKTL